MADTQNGTANGSAVMARLGEVMKIYTDEANKRLALRPEGSSQFVELKEADSDRFKSLGEDPWTSFGDQPQAPPLIEGSHCKFLVLGAGFGGIVFAVRLIQAGFSAEDIRFVDPAGGFGGTWYWNRYPGLHCDVDSSIYLPLLEETGYMPKSKYSTGEEILEHVNRIVDHWKLTDKCLFRTEAREVTWQDEKQCWAAKLVQNRGPGHNPQEVHVTSQYVLMASGVLTRPQVPKIPSLESFAGDMFHTARWDYSATGGSPTDQSLTKLANKRVGIIGTGATGIQVVPQLAKWAKEVYVFQRTPSVINWRGQKKIDPEEWKSKVATHLGWQLERMANYTAFTTRTYGPAPQVPNMIADAWTEIPTLGALTGSPVVKDLLPIPEQIAEHIGKLNVMDLPIAEKNRARVDEIVKDPEVAKKLKAWYPSWCKRCTFSDEYLQCFNQPNVTLVDTDGRGVEAASKSGLVIDGKDYPLDMLVLCTGYTSPAAGDASPATRMDLKVTGRDGLDFDHKWQTLGTATLHGVMTNGFPNLVFLGHTQAGATSNFMEPILHETMHAAYMIKEAEARKSKPDASVVVEVTKAAEEAWTMECLKRAGGFAVITTCTPGYITQEGDRSRFMATATQEEMMKMSRLVGWGEGMTSYVAVIEAWRREGSLAGVEIRA